MDKIPSLKGDSRFRTRLFVVGKRDGNDLGFTRLLSCDFVSLRSRQENGYPECLHNPSLYKQFGRVTSRLHELSREYIPVTRRHDWRRNEYLLRAADYISDEPVLHALEKLMEQVAALPISAETFGLIHGDLNVGNVRVGEDGTLTLFDFDECQYSWFVEDIAVQLFYLLYVFGEDSKNDRRAQYELFLHHFIEGYTESGQRLPEGWKEQLPLFLRLREIIVYVGMHRSWDLQHADLWTQDFLRDSRMRITHARSLIDDFL
ncbi:phosphotransferase [Paenibacillus aurantius]|uniref:Phosphotransferase n=1 Tax=Paenibacillus aurantius TaxID=2918900 RepID=A0AA96RFR2_9BACL|nr:phosphotransferase [Paenibacillus aurantius]WNQ12282.1 phosphotransferase [Paenibacillus aurantius]